jgi:hypothetical protein
MGRASGESSFTLPDGRGGCRYVALLDRTAEGGCPHMIPALHGIASCGSCRVVGREVVGLGGSC